MQYTIHVTFFFNDIYESINSSSVITSFVSVSHSFSIQLS